MVKMKSTKLTGKLLLQYQARWRFTAVGAFASIVLWCASNICSDWRRIQTNLTIELKMCALVFNCRTIIARVVNMGINRFLKAYGRFLPMRTFARLQVFTREARVCMLCYFSPCVCQMQTQTAKFMGLKWGPPGSCRPQMDPMLAPWALLSGNILIWDERIGVVSAN